jgi:hypothetical protein
MALKFAVNNSLSAVTSLPTAIPTGSMTLLQTQTASSSASVEFTTGIDSTYDVYLIKIINAHPSVDDSRLTYQGSTDSGSSFGVTATTTGFRALHHEDDSSSGLGYQTSADLAQSTSFQRIGILGSGGDNDECCSGELYLYNPSSTTFVKHFMTRMAETGAEPRAVDGFSAGYFNTTSAINGIQFKFDNSSNIDDGVFKLYGIS